MMHSWYDNGWGTGSWIAMALTMLAFVGLVAAFVVYAIHNLGHRPGDHINAPSPPADKALRILDERFARGEVDTDEYNHRREALRSP
jgi:putative membrane protein